MENRPACPATPPRTIGVFVLDFALDDSLAEGAAGYAWLRFFCRQLAGGGARATLIFRAFVGGGRNLSADV